MSVWQQERLRWLDFGDGAVQSIIDIDHPDQLISPVYHAMLAPMLFVPIPKRILLLGVGGGALARYFNYRFPAVQGEAVEILSPMAEIARRYFDFPAEENGWRLIVEDARQYVSVPSEKYDLIIVDIAHQQKTPDWITAPKFLQDCRRTLTDCGVLVLNLLMQDAESFGQSLWNLRRCYDKRVVCLSVPEYKNIELFAFHGSVPQQLSGELESRASEMAKRWGIAFLPLAERMRQENPVGSGVF
ncbi:hypothetical protein [endosymbiont of Lamellibrachia barhami]|uniref:spermine/spermidine synthase domain-containing protein n=1 Tax=endosymbiont of Lamellibrachia barhami TaxID=205975 RepID=UPI0015AF3C26|nr:hypothetical protein [endosymbiont of Lamellibrachia barhami]